MQNLLSKYSCVLTDAYFVYYMCLDPNGNSVQDGTGMLWHIELLTWLSMWGYMYRELMKCPLYEQTYNFQYQAPNPGYITAKVDDTPGIRALVIIS